MPLLAMRMSYLTGEDFDKTILKKKNTMVWTSEALVKLRKNARKPSAHSRREQAKIEIENIIETIIG